VDNNVVIKTLASGRNQRFKKKNETHVALCENFFGLVSTTNPVKSSKDTASLVDCTQKKFWWRATDFL